MKLDTALQRIPGWYQAGLSVFLTSAPGMGKTTTLVQAPAMLASRLQKNMGLVVINGGNLNEMDVQGYLVPRHQETYTESLFTRPFWWRTTEGKNLDDYDGGVIIVDEADKCPVEVKKILGEACESNRLGSHILPKGWIVWMAGNRAGDRSGSTKELDHLINRRMEIEIHPDLDSWTNWATRNDVQPVTIGFANSNPEIVFQSKVPDKQGPWCTPRSLCKLDRYLATLAGKGNDIPTDVVAKEEASGLIGEGPARQYYVSIELDQKMPKYEAIVADPKKVKVPERPDALMLVVYNLAHRVVAADAGKVIEYIDRMPKEFSVTFAKAACNRDAKLVNAPAFQQWCMQNASLVALIAAK